MGVWTVVIIILAILLLGSGGAFLFSKKAGKKKFDSESVNKTIRKENLGVYEVNGTANEFHIVVNSGEIGFLVEKGVITAYRTKTSPNYKKYQIEGRRI